MAGMTPSDLIMRFVQVKPKLLPCHESCSVCQRQRGPRSRDGHDSIRLSPRSMDLSLGLPTGFSAEFVSHTVPSVGGGMYDPGLDKRFRKTIRTRYSSSTGEVVQAGRHGRRGG